MKNFTNFYHKTVLFSDNADGDRKSCQIYVKNSTQIVNVSYAARYRMQISSLFFGVHQ